MGEKISYCIIIQKKSKISFWLKMSTIEQETNLVPITEAEKIRDIFDVDEKKVASVQMIKNGVLEIIPLVKNVSKTLCSISDIICKVADSNNQTSILIRTKKDIIFQSNADENETLISQSPLTIACCYPL